MLNDEADTRVSKNKHSELETKFPSVGKKPLTDLPGWEDFKLSGGKDKEEGFLRSRAKSKAINTKTFWW